MPLQTEVIFPLFPTRSAARALRDVIVHFIGGCLRRADSTAAAQKVVEYRNHSGLKIVKIFINKERRFSFGKLKKVCVLGVKHNRILLEDRPRMVRLGGKWIIFKRPHNAAAFGKVYKLTFVMQEFKKSFGVFLIFRLSGNKHKVACVRVVESCALSAVY